MKIMTTQRWATPEQNHGPGAVVDVHPTIAQQMLDSGGAKLLEPFPEPGSIPPLLPAEPEVFLAPTPLGPKGKVKKTVIPGADAPAIVVMPDTPVEAE